MRRFTWIHRHEPAGVTGATTFMYQWVYVDGNGSVTGNPTGASSTMQSYTLTVNDAGQEYAG